MSDKTEMFNKLLDERIQPIVTKITEIYSNTELTPELKDAEVYNAVAVAVMEGVSLSQKMYEMKEESTDTKSSVIEETMRQHQKAKDAAARLNMKHGLGKDGKPRFCTPDQFDENGKFKG